jgi:lipoprotein-releasing system ATP-binding protein
MRDLVSSIVTAENLKKTYWLGKKAINVLNGISFSVTTGEMVAILGPSGIGKSTLLHLLGTLDVPTAGQILISNQDVLSFSPDKLASFRNRTIGFVFQFHHLLPEFSALENTMMPALIQRIPREKARIMALDVLEKVGLEKRVDHRPVELSGGEQQRVALARALVLKPILLLADEPTGNLDEVTGAGIHKLLFDLNRELGMTTVVVTHNPGLAEQMTRKLYLRDDGTIRHE